MWNILISSPCLTINNYFFYILISTIDYLDEWFRFRLPVSQELIVLNEPISGPQYYYTPSSIELNTTKGKFGRKK